MNTTATLEQLNELKLAGMTRSYQAILQMPLNQHPEAHALIAQLVQAEKQNRIQYKTQIYLKLSKLRYIALLEEITCSRERNLSKEQLLQLSDCAYLDRAENILISGATGAGKSFLACALAIKLV